MPEQDAVSLSDVLHAVDLLRRDVSRVDDAVSKLVSMERYLIEHEVQQQAIARVEARLDANDKKSETMRHMILSSFLFPLAIAVIIYMITTTSGGT